MLRRSRSRAAVLVWCLEHAVLVAACCAAAGPVYVKLAAALALLAHARWTWPKSPRWLAGSTEGPWSGDPPFHRRVWTLADQGTIHARHWARLRFASRAGGVWDELVWADELEPRTWRRLSLALRERQSPGRRAGDSRQPNWT